MNTDRIKEIQQGTAYPESVSVQQALLKVWNETAQEQLRIDVVRRSCIEFAEWILKEGFEKYEDNGKCWWGRFKEEDKDYSTEQLYEIWSSNYA